jgi:hypothetical protein
MGCSFDAYPEYRAAKYERWWLEDVRHMHATFKRWQSLDTIRANFPDFKESEIRAARAVVRAVANEVELKDHGPCP